jgi:hypothetical protein
MGGHADVPPFSGNAVRPFAHDAVNTDAATAPGPHDYPEYQAISSPCPGPAFSQGEAVGIIAYRHRPAKQLLEVVLQWVADQAGGVGIADQAGPFIQ